MKFIKTFIKKVFKLFKNFFKYLKKISWKKKVLYILLSIILIGVFFYFLNKSKVQEGYVFDTVKKSTITQVVSETGNVITAGKTDVYSPSMGIIEEVYVSNGSIVGIDDPLFRVKSTATQDEKASTYADLITAQNSLKTAQQNKLTLQTTLEEKRKAIINAQDTVDDIHLQSYNQLQKDSLQSVLTSARWDFNDVEKRYVEADFTIQTAQAQINKAQYAYLSTQDRIVKSPTIGTVSNLSVSVGDSVTSYIPNVSLLVSPPNPVLKIANFSTNGVELKLNESDITKLEVGQEVKIESNTISNKKYKGIVSRVDSMGTNDQGVITYKVYIDITNSDDSLRSGMTVDVDIITKKLTKTLSVPNSSIKPYKGEKGIQILDLKTKNPKLVPVTIGVQGNLRTQILGGVKEGEQIITSLKNEKIQREGFLGF
ncbi:MAG: HlyD family efflux transporter periplasmic adaptor subunit [bacterium]